MKEYKITLNDIKKEKQKSTTNIFHILHEGRRCEICGHIDCIEFRPGFFPGRYNRYCTRCKMIISD